MALNLLGSNDPVALFRALMIFLEAGVEEMPVGPARALADLPVIVPDRTRRDWLRDRIARHQGICAGVRIVLHEEFLVDYLAPAVGLQEARWDRDLAMARLLAELPRIPALAQVLDRQAGAPLGGRAWNLAQGLLDGFDRVALHRLTSDASGATGRDGASGTTAASVGIPRQEPADLGAALDLVCADQPWQAQLWRAIAADPAVGDPLRWQRRLEAALAQGGSGLPPRLAVVESSGPSAAAWRIFAALARHTEVLIASVHPTWGDWDWVRRWAGLARSGPGEGILASWGTAARRIARHALELGARDLRLEALCREPAGDGVLARVQRALLHPDVEEQPEVEEQPGAENVEQRRPGKDTLTFHATHGLRRQLEVVRHEFALMFDQDPTLAPHEVAILCPDPEAVAPMAAAIFASPGEGPPVSLDARRAASPGQDGLELALRLVDLLPGRWEAPTVMSVLDHPLVQERHGLDGARVREWISSADLRWGVDGAHRHELGLAGHGQGTWTRGLLRLELAAWHGADADAGHHWLDPDEPGDAGVVPATDIHEDDLLPLRRLIAVLSPLLAAASAWRRARAVAVWCDDLERLLDGLIGAGPARAQTTVLLGRWRQVMQRAGGGPDLGAGALRELLAGGASGGGTTVAGGIALGSISQLGGLDWRVVALVGMDDGAFPRQVQRRDMDPLARNRRAEDPDPRADDRWRLLQTVCTVTDRLLITWTGHHAVSGEHLPSALVVQELLAMAERLGGGGTLITHHRLHAAHERPRMWPSASLAHQARAFRDAESSAERTGSQQKSPIPAQARTDEAKRAESVLRIEEFLSLCTHPPSAFLEGVGIRLEKDDEVRAHELFSVTELDRWILDRRLLAGATCARLAAAGILPPLPQGVAVYRERTNALAPLAAWLHPQQESLHEQAMDLTIAGVRLVGSLTDILPRYGPLMARGTEADATQKLRLALRSLIWLVAGGRPDTADGEGRCGVLAYPHKKSGALVLSAWRCDPDQARPLLAGMVDWAMQGRTQLRPITAEIARALLVGEDEQAVPLLPRRSAHADIHEAWLTACDSSTRNYRACRRLWPDPTVILEQAPLIVDLAEQFRPFLASAAWSTWSQDQS